MVKFNAVHRIWAERGQYRDNPYAYLKQFLLALKEIGCFITMSEAMEGSYSTDRPCFVLDHHIDYYPIETMELLRWEAANEIRSSVYIFNRYNSLLNRNQIDWRLNDLDIDLLQSVEQQGFEIGYHVNAVGLAKADKGSVQRYHKHVDPDIAASARANFSRDVAALREHFTIKTAVPHGAGEGNNLIDLGYRANDIIPLYNSRALDFTPNIKWRNFSDSVGKYYSKLNSEQSVVYLSSQDRFGTFLNLVENKIYHILIHPGRYGEGMAYDNYDYAKICSANDVSETSSARQQVKTNTGTKWLFSKRPEALFDALMSGATEKLCLVREQRFTPEIREHYKVPRPTSTTVEFPASQEAFLSEFYWYDTLFCPRGFSSIEKRLEAEDYTII